MDGGEGIRRRRGLEGGGGVTGDGVMRGRFADAGEFISPY